MSEATGYNSVLGYGWQSGVIRSVDRRTSNALDRDLNYARDAIFATNVPSGLYTAELTLGDRGSYAHDRMGVFLEGRQVDTVSTAAGQIVTRSYEVEVRDGQLTLQLRDLGGSDANITIEALRVVAAGQTLPVLTIGDASGNEGNAGTSQLLFTVSLSQASQQTVSVTWATSANTATTPADFTAASSVLSIPAGSTTGTIAVSVIGDLDAESSETFWVDLSQPSGAILGDSRGVGTIVNDDASYGDGEFASYFDFGTPSSALAAGYTRVSEATVYSSALGYGWRSGVIRSVDRGSWGALDRDLNYTPDGTFLLDLPVGTYDVDIILGDRGSYGHDQVGVYLEGQLKETVTTAAGQAVAKQYEITVTDGHRSCGCSIWVAATRTLASKHCAWSRLTRFHRRRTLPGGRCWPRSPEAGSRIRCGMGMGFWCTPWSLRTSPGPPRSACCFPRRSHRASYTRPFTYFRSNRVVARNTATVW